MNEENKPVDLALVIEAFRILLDTYYYHPILWGLQYVSRTLRDQRPQSFGRREIKIHDYAHVDRDEIWLNGMLGGTRDMLLYDVKKPFEAVMAFASDENDTKSELYDDEADDCEKVFYRIPAAWLRYVYARRENSNVFMYLVQEPFCCRQILLKGSVTVVQCRINVIDERFAIHPSYFHVGVGDCWDETHAVF
jgi:hypothetical protein